MWDIIIVIKNEDKMFTIDTAACDYDVDTKTFAVDASDIQMNGFPWYGLPNTYRPEITAAIESMTE